MEMVRGDEGKGEVWGAGRVEKGRTLQEDSVDGSTVAVKFVKRARAFHAGVHLGAVAELRALQELRHRNVVRLRDVFPARDSLCLVLEHCVGDLENVLANPSQVLREADIKAWAFQLLSGLAYLSSRGWIHGVSAAWPCVWVHACACSRVYVYMYVYARRGAQDLKPANLLLASDGTIRITDFGHAARESLVSELPLFHGVFTLWYRAPELLLAARTHTAAADVWAAGCIIAEMMLRRPLFTWSPGNPVSGPMGEERGQWAEICRLRGTPRDWEGVESLPGYVALEECAELDMATILEPAGLSALAANVVGLALTLNPTKRPSAAQLLRHPWFSTAPAPTPAGSLPLPK
jgi:cyclin-dependent kinase 7